MVDQWHGGKGSKRRNSNEKAYADNWEKIFGKKDDKSKRKDSKSTGTKKQQKDI
jgi:hypothetical protein|tara:strand:+ start:616 stop:777 length:162 start_codon:yes stop_codon:yes gene_type:complete